MAEAIQKEKLDDFNFFSNGGKVKKTKKRSLVNKLIWWAIYAFCAFNIYSVYNIKEKISSRTVEVNTTFENFPGLKQDLENGIVNTKKIAEFQDGNLMINDLIFGTLVVTANMNEKMTAKRKEELNVLYEQNWDKGFKNEKSAIGDCTIDVMCYAIKEVEKRNVRYMKTKILERRYEFDHINEYKKYLKENMNGNIHEPPWKKYFETD